MTRTLSTETLQNFVGGEAEIQNKNENYLFRGDITSIAIENNELRIKFAWLAKNLGGAPTAGMSDKWEIDPKLEYDASLEIYTPSDIDDNRMAFTSWIVGETVVLFPPNGSKLNPDNINGFPENLKVQQAKKFRLYNESR